MLQVVWDCCELNIHGKEALAEVDQQAQAMQPWMWSVVSTHVSGIRQTDYECSDCVPSPGGLADGAAARKEHQKLDKDMSPNMALSTQRTMSNLILTAAS